VAFPVLAPGLVLGRWRSEPTARALAATAAGFGLLVALTQYARGGGFEWGWRYVAIGLPLAVPVALLGLRRALDAVDRTRVVQAVAVGLVAVSAGLAWMGADVRRSLDRATEDFGRRVLAAAPESHVGAGDADGRPVVLSLFYSAPQLIWPTYGEARWLHGEGRDAAGSATGEQAPIVRGLVDAGVDRFSILTPDLGRAAGFLHGLEVDRTAQIHGWTLLVVRPAAERAR
jgi:hypothetical protein